MDVKWFQMTPGRSWHIYRGVTETGLAQAYCGRVGQRPIVDERPGNEKTCEVCLRIAGPK